MFLPVGLRPETLARALVSGTIFSSLVLAAPSDWVVARSAHFEVYSHGGLDRARSALTWFEELRAFFDRNGVIGGGSKRGSRPPVRVIGFRSKEEYSAFKIRATADAYYTASEDRDYIVMPALGPEEFGVASHEYAHFVLRSAGLNLPGWLNEGLAEVFSTVRITNLHCDLGGELPIHVATLGRHSWLPAALLLTAASDSPLRATREGAAVFYAESWAMADMLVSSPLYSARFGALIAAINAGESSSQAIEKTYGHPAEKILQDAQHWITQAKFAKLSLPALAPEQFVPSVSNLSEFQAHALLAELMLVNGELDRAEQSYRDLLRQSRADPDILAFLGTIALRKSNPRAAMELWAKAIAHGQRDAALCYRYAVLADQAGLPSREISGALELAIASQPDFDDARYQLALLRSNAGEYNAAVAQLRAMGKPSPSRAYGYWTALAYALTELDERGEAESAARQAMKFATTATERTQAAQLSYIANTDMAVRFARDAQGQLQMVTTRVPHGSADWNPFVEPEDHIQRANGKLREVVCGEGRLTGFLVSSAGGTLALSVPDPTHVLMRNAPSQFNCGPQPSRDVTVEYATAIKAGKDVLRGMEFHQ